MKHKLLSALMLVALSVLLASPSYAQGKVYVGYCDSSIADDKNGLIGGVSGNDVDIDLAIRIPQNLLASYAGCQVAAVNLGLPNVKTFPSSVKGWVRTSRDGANLAEGTKSGLKPGWCPISMKKPYVITGQEEELWVGVTYHQASKISFVSFAGETDPNGAWSCKNGKWTDFSANKWGSLSIEAIVEGNVPTHNLTLISAGCKDTYVKLGSSFTVTGSIKNQATSTAVRPKIRYAINGGEAREYTIPVTLAYHESAEFSFDISTEGMTEEGECDVRLELVWGDGTPDDHPGDNVYSVAVQLVKELYYRKMVVEEGTGAWCGFCVVGIVGLREMKKNYPDRFIGIAVHDGDSYTVSSYDSWFVSQIGDEGLPSCLINRDGNVGYPSEAELKAFYQNMPSVADADIQVQASVTGKKITFESTTRFFKPAKNADYRVAFVVLENQLPITQKNYYADNVKGEMGGFEKLERDCHIYVDDVARGIYPSIQGTKGALPSTVERATDYKYTYTATLPTYKKSENVEVVALLLNGKTGEIVQAAKTSEIYDFNAEWPEGITPTLSAIDSEPSNSYDLTGRKVSQPQRGQLFIQGRKIQLRR